MKTQANNNDPAWVRRMAELDDNSELTVGGLAHELGMFEGPAAPTPLAKSAFAKLIELRRRERHLTVEQLAARAEVGMAELVGIELGKVDAPELLTVAKLAAVLELPAQKLMQLSGTVMPKNARFAEAVVRFAARSEPVNQLSPEEHDALKEFVKFLAEP
jgi:HTH-type transcriptional regulator, competence development regulator